MALCIEDFIYECTYRGVTETWAYEGDKEYRYVLGKCGRNPLLCFGINPSNACIKHIGEKDTLPQVKPDHTMCRVRNVSVLLGFDGYIMLNLYPFIDKDPSKLKNLDKDLIIEKKIELNLRYIETVYKNA